MKTKLNINVSLKPFNIEETVSPTNWKSLLQSNGVDTSKEDELLIIEVL